MTVRLIGTVGGAEGDGDGVRRAGAASGFVRGTADFVDDVAGRLGAPAGLVACDAGSVDVSWARPVIVIRTSSPAVAECRRTFKRGLGPLEN